MTGEEWRACRRLAHVKWRQFRRRLAALRPAIFYAIVAASFVSAYAITTTQQTESPKQQHGNSSPAEKGSPGPGAGEDANDRIADYTLGLEWFTGALAVFALIEIWVLVRSEDAMRRATQIAERQMKITALQTDIIAKQHEVGRQQFFAVHRPRLVVREAAVVNIHPYAAVQFTIANVGASAARIIESAAEFRIGTNLIAIDPPPSENQVEEAVVEPGGYITHGVVSDITGLSLRLAAADLDSSYWEREEAMILRGFLVYLDDVTKVRRRTAFWRIYDPKNARFKIVDDPDREYAD